jgi:predicted RNA-binding protein with PIN domain
MINFAGFYGYEITVVFDGHSLKGSGGSAENVGPVTVEFSAEGETADSVIERMAGEQGEDAEVYVATSDYAEQRMILGRGAHRISAREFRMDVDKMVLAFKRFDKSDDRSQRFLDQRLDDTTRQKLEKMRRK